MTIALLMLSCCGLFAQKHVTMDLNGLVIGRIYTKKQVVARLGEPVVYRSSESEFGLDEGYLGPGPYEFLLRIFRYADPVLTEKHRPGRKSGKSPGQDFLPKR